MAKRFTDTEKWERPWFRQLSAENKSLWLYILDKCDIAGVWYVDLELAGFIMRTEYDPENTYFALEKQITKLDGGKKWWVNDFPRFQYGSLRPGVNLHDSVIRKMEEHAEMKEELKMLVEFGDKKRRAHEGLTRTWASPKDKDKNKDRGKDKETTEKGVLGEKEKKPRKKSDYQLLIEHFAANREVKLENNAQERTFFGMHGEAAKSILEQAGGDLELAKLAVTEIAAWADGEVRAGKWDPWKNLAALEKRFVEWKSEYNKDMSGEGNGHKKA